MFRIICLAIGYAFGMIQTAYFVGRASGIDIREHGSKNAGFTNTNRVLGRKAGAIVFVIDVIKAIVAFAIATIIYNHLFVIDSRIATFAGGTFFNTNYFIPGLYAGIGAVLGHVYPFYLRFKGGKGVSCALGVILMLDWRVALIAFSIGIITVAVTRYISLASLLITLSVPVQFILFNSVQYFRLASGDPSVHDMLATIDGMYPSEAIWLTAALAVFVWYLHRENIKRLLSGTENKFSFRKSPASPPDIN